MPRITRKEGFGKRGRKVETRIARTEKKDLPAAGGSLAYARAGYYSSSGDVAMDSSGPNYWPVFEDIIDQSGGFELVVGVSRTGSNMHGIKVPQAGVYVVSWKCLAKVSWSGSQATGYRMFAVEGLHASISDPTQISDPFETLQWTLGTSSKNWYGVVSGQIALPAEGQVLPFGRFEGAGGAVPSAVNFERNGRNGMELIVVRLGDSTGEHFV